MRHFCLIAGIWVVFWGVSQAADEPAADSKAIGITEAVQMIPSEMQTPGRYALLIGVSDYQDERVPDLPACVNDAQSLKNVLLDPMHGMFLPENVTLLLNEKVTGKEVVDALDKISRKAGKDDLVIVFFSGHGAVDERGRSYWVMHDTDITRLRATALPENDITELTDQIKSNRLVMLIDSCYAASTAQIGGSKSLLDLKSLYPQFTGQGRVAITASKGDQLSVVIKDKQHPGYGFSAFSWNIISGLKGDGDADHDGVVTVSELWDYVKDRTESTARQQGGEQQPQLKGQLGSKFLFTVDGAKLIENSQLVQQSMATLKTLFMEDKITPIHYKEAEQLIKTDPAKLSETDQQKRQVYLDLAEGRLAAQYLQAALDAIETHSQRAARLEKEASEQTEQIKKNRIKELLSIVRANDNKTDGKKALEAMNELLTLDPGNIEAQTLQKKISGYFGPNAGDIIANSIGMKLIYIPAGDFMMGSPDSESGRDKDELLIPQVTISGGFYMGLYEVTQSQWSSIMGTSVSQQRNKINQSWLLKGEGETNPMYFVSWEEAVTFCEKLSQKEGRSYTLPTEAQWEYACRAGSRTRYSFGDNDSQLGDYAWYDKNGNGTTHPVGQKKPNGWGLYDMHGNVWEWCLDWYGESYYSSSPASDPQGTGSGQCRVLRGGSWNNDSNCRSADRGFNAPSFAFSHVGFRVVCLDQKTKIMGENKVKTDSINSTHNESERENEIERGYIGVMMNPEGLTPELAESFGTEISEIGKKLGLTVTPIDSDVARKLNVKGDKGVAVAEVKPNSSADKAGIEPGMLILGVNKVIINTVTEFDQALEQTAKTKKASLLVKTGRFSQYVVLYLKE